MSVVKTMVFPVGLRMIWKELQRKLSVRRIDAFELSLEKTDSPTARRSIQSIRYEISPIFEKRELALKLKLHIDGEERLLEKTSDTGERLMQVVGRQRRSDSWFDITESMI